MDQGGVEGFSGVLEALQEQMTTALRLAARGEKADRRC
jgi:hypothetical protein